MATNDLRAYSPSSEEKTYGEKPPLEQDRPVSQDVGEGDGDSSHNLHRGLKSRQITMIAIGGAIGTGLIIGTYVFFLL